MELIIILFFFLLCFYVILKLFIVKDNSGIKINNDKQKQIFYYKKKYFMTDAELDFYSTINELESKYKIVPQICLGTFIIKKGSNYRNELNKYIDYAIFSSDYKELLLLIELNDSSHLNEDRIERDKKVKSICDDAGIKLITFYTNKPNNKEYVISRIEENISKYR